MRSQRVNPVDLGPHRGAPGGVRLIGAERWVERDADGVQRSPERRQLGFLGVMSEID
jgi:hypothetical protein